MMSMKKLFKVEISYLEFCFDDLSEAAQFADTAARTLSSKEDDIISMTFECVRKDESGEE